MYSYYKCMFNLFTVQKYVIKPINAGKTVLKVIGLSGLTN